MTANIGTVDRHARIVLGIALLTLAICRPEDDLGPSRPCTRGYRRGALLSGLPAFAR